MSADSLSGADRFLRIERPNRLKPLAHKDGTQHAQPIALLRFAISLVALLALASSSACGDNVAFVAVDAGQDAMVVGQGAFPTGDLIVSEISPSGEGPDWIELFHRGEEALDRCDFFVTDRLDRLDHYLPLGGAAPPDPCEPFPIEPGEFIVIAADDGDGPNHAPFRLGPADEVHVVSIDGRALDSIVYLVQDAWPKGSLARIPTADGLFYPAAPSPGAANPTELP